jgi:hypothetical protein
VNHKLSQDAIGASELQSGIQRVVFARARGPGRITVATSLHRAATCGNVKIRVAGIGLSRADREVRALSAFLFSLRDPAVDPGQKIWISFHLWHD